MLAQHGIKMIIFEDLPDNEVWQILKINPEGKVELIDASEYIGLNNYPLVQKLYTKYGKEISVMSIGTAAERGSLITTLQVTDATTKHPSRAAARGGLGAVAASKKIKAVVIEKAAQRSKFNYYNQEEFNRANRRLVNHFRSSPGAKRLREAGTMSIIDYTSASAILPVKNFSGEFLSPEELEKINMKAWTKRANMYGGKQGVACSPGCIIQCSNIFNNSKGEYITNALEYETVALCGPNWDISDFEFIAEMDRICDDLGIDTIELGGTIGVLLDVGRLPWGDKNAIRGVVNEMVEGKTELGKLMLQGTETVGKICGAKRIPAVIGQSLPAYDPRNAKGMGVTYSTSPMGADHTAGHSLIRTIQDESSKVGMVEFSKLRQIIFAASDNIACNFTFPSTLVDTRLFTDVLRGAYGEEWSWEKILDIGIQTLKLEQEFNDAAGLTVDKDRLPEFIYKEPSPVTGSVFDISYIELQAVFE